MVSIVLGGHPPNAVSRSGALGKLGILAARFHERPMDQSAIGVGLTHPFS